MLRFSFLVALLTFVALPAQAGRPRAYEQQISYTNVDVSTSTQTSGSVSPVPEPGAALVFAACLGLIAARQRRPE